MQNNILISILIGICGIGVGIVLMILLGSAGISKSKNKAQNILDEANSKADGIMRQATLDGKQQIYELKLEAEKEIKKKMQEVSDSENKLLRREDNLNFRDQTITHKEKEIADCANEQNIIWNENFPTVENCIHVPPLYDPSGSILIKLIPPQQ